MSAGGPGWADRLPKWTWWAVAVAFMTVLYWDGLSAWFIADDFAWLGLLRGVYTPHDLLTAMFAPAAQGTIRPWSERGFFLLYESLFGLDSVPFRVTAFATFAADLALLGWVVRRLTRSRFAAFIAAIVWTSNAALATSMTWSSAFNQFLCPLFLLGALCLFILYCETGKNRYWWLQVVVFVLGFGALEINVVYPAIALAWALFVAAPEKRRQLAIRAGWLFPVSIAYFIVHTIAAPLPKTGDYGVHIDARIFTTLKFYLKTSLLPLDWAAFKNPVLLGKAIIALGAVSILALLVVELRKGRRAILFGAVWYFATLSPVLILPQHLTDYYVTTPVAGLAILAGMAISGTRTRQLWAAVAIGAYLYAMVPVARSATKWRVKQTLPIETLVLGVEAAHQAHPGKAILLDGLTPDQYVNSIGQGAFYPLGIDEVYLTPGSDKDIEVTDGVADTSRTVLEPETTIHAVTSGQALVYTAAGDHLRNITVLYSLAAPAKFPQAVGGAPTHLDPGNPLYSWLLGSGWAPAEDRAAWMRGDAHVQIKSPETAGWKLALEGFFQEDQLKTGPRTLRASANGVEIGSTKISDPEASFKRLFALPDSLVGKKVLDLEIQVTPVTRKGGMDYGALFGKIAVVK